MQNVKLQQLYLLQLYILILYNIYIIVTDISVTISHFDSICKYIKYSVYEIHQIAENILKRKSYY